MAGHGKSCVAAFLKGDEHAIDTLRTVRCRIHQERCRMMMKGANAVVHPVQVPPRGSISRCGDVDVRAFGNMERPRDVARVIRSYAARWDPGSMQHWS